MRRLFIHAALPLFAVLGFFVGLSTAEPKVPAPYQVAALVGPMPPPALPDVAAEASDSDALAPATLADLAPSGAVLQVTEGELRRGSTLSHAMRSRGIPPDVVDVIAGAGVSRKVARLVPLGVIKG